MGIERSKKAAQSARIIIYVADTQSDITPLEALKEIEDYSDSQLIIVFNKSDIANDFDETTWKQSFNNVTMLHCSALLSTGIEELRQTIHELLNENREGEDIIVANSRHAQALRQASDSLRAFATALRSGVPTDLAAQDLRQSIYHLSTITGAITTPEILQNIFTHFCIGK